MTTKRDQIQKDLVIKEEGEDELANVVKNYGEGIKIMRWQNGVLSEIGGEDSDNEEAEENEEVK